MPEYAFCRFYHGCDRDGRCMSTIRRPPYTSTNSTKVLVRKLFTSTLFLIYVASNACAGNRGESARHRPYRLPTLPSGINGRFSTPHCPASHTRTLPPHNLGGSFRHCGVHHGSIHHAWNTVGPRLSTTSLDHVSRPRLSTTPLDRVSSPAAIGWSCSPGGLPRFQLR